MNYGNGHFLSWEPQVPLFLFLLLIVPDFVLAGSIDANALGNSLSSMGAPKIKIDDVTSIDLAATDQAGDPRIWAGNDVLKGDPVATIEWSDATNTVSVYPDINNAPTPDGWGGPTEPPVDSRPHGQSYWRAKGVNDGIWRYGYNRDELGLRTCEAQHSGANMVWKSAGSQRCEYDCNNTRCSFSQGVSQVYQPDHCAPGYEHVGNECQAPEPNATWGSDSNSVLYAGSDGFEPVQWDEDTAGQAWADVTETCPFDDCKADMVPIESPNLPQTDYLQTTANEVQYVQFAKIKEPDGTDSVIEQAVTIDKATSTVTSTVARKHSNSTVTQAKAESAVPIILATGETPQQNGTDNGLLQEIADNTSGEGFDASGIGEPEMSGTRTLNQSMDELMAIADRGPIGAISGLSPGTLSTTCPIWTAEVPFLDTTLIIDAHCDLITEHQAIISAAVKAAYSLLAIIIFLG